MLGHLAGQWQQHSGGCACGLWGPCRSCGAGLRGQVSMRAVSGAGALALALGLPPGVCSGKGRGLSHLCHKSPLPCSPGPALCFWSVS